jgi:hypothetical protein
VVSRRGAGHRPGASCAVMLTAALSLLLPGCGGQRDRDATVQAPATKRAGDFVDSVGVNVHLGYADTPYGHRDIVKAKLLELGVRYIRDGLNPGQPAVYHAWRDLASRGIRLDLIAGDPLRRGGIGPIKDQLAIVKGELLHAVASLEGPNEYDNQGDPNWASTLRDYQRQLYEQVKHDPALTGIPVVGPTVVKPDSHDQLGDISRWLDYGNMHPYPSGAPPDLDSQLNQELQWAAANADSKRVQATETGYHNALNANSPHRGTSEEAAGVYVPRLFLDYFRRGVARTFDYELVDEHPDQPRENIEANFGLLRNDFSEKPAFVALKRLIALLRDPGPSFKTGSLDYSIKDAPTSLRQVLLQKHDGSFDLALWNAVSIWDPTTAKPLSPADPSVQVVFAEPMRRVEVYRPSRLDQPLERHANVRSLKLQASPDVAVIRIVPGPASRPPAKPVHG